MKIVVVGATGTIGSAVVTALQPKHEVVQVSRHSIPAVDLSDPASIKAMYASVGPVDAVISTAGSGQFGPLASLTDADFEFGLGNKLMGQIDLVRFGLEHVNPGGSITLTSGILATQPNPNSVLLTTLNSAVEGFVRAAALNAPNEIRINAVSPPLVRETVLKMGWGDGGEPADVVAQLYVESIEGGASGRVISDCGTASMASNHDAAGTGFSRAAASA